MAQQWQIRRGTNSENNDFTGAAGEVTMDTDRKELRLHDGSTQGGTIIGRNYKSNCITEIPQDIKLELNAGTLILKAGSKVYVPNGVGVFDKVVVPTDLSYSYAGSTVGPTDGLMFYDSTANVIFLEARTQTDSGTSRTSVNTFYNTNTNIIDSTNTLVPSQSDKISFPVCSVKYGTSVSGTGHISLPETFNGFGYVGSTVFALPGVKGLIPNGRNIDGTLKNIPITLSSVTTYTQDTTGTNNIVILSDGSINLAGITYWIYDEHKNIWVHNSNTLSMVSIGISEHNVKITSFTPKTTFHAVDYSEADFVVSYQRPTSANNYTWYRLYKSGWVEQGGIKSNASGSRTVSVTFPVTMLDTNYTASTTLNYGSTDWSATVNCLVLTKTTTGLTLMNYYNSSSNNGPMTWLIQGFSNVNV